MKALTLFEPHATLIMCGVKRFETRSWGCAHRGPLAIHVSGRRIQDQLNWTVHSPSWPADLTRRTLRELGYLDGGGERAFLPGVVLGVVDLAAIHLAENVSLTPQEQLQEHAFGDWRAGRRVWELRNIRPFCEPIAYKGSRGLWEWEPPADWQSRLEVEPVQRWFVAIHLSATQW